MIVAHVVGETAIRDRRNIPKNARKYRCPRTCAICPRIRRTDKQHHGEGWCRGYVRLSLHCSVGGLPTRRRVDERSRWLSRLVRLPESTLLDVGQQKDQRTGTPVSL